MRKAPKKTVRKTTAKEVKFPFEGISECQLSNLLHYFEVYMDYDSYRKRLRDLRDRYTSLFLILMDTDSDFRTAFDGSTMRDDLEYLDVIIQNEDKPDIPDEVREKLEGLLLEAKTIISDLPKS